MTSFCARKLDKNYLLLNKNFSVVMSVKNALDIEVLASLSTFLDVFHTGCDFAMKKSEIG